MRIDLLPRDSRPLNQQISAFGAVTVVTSRNPVSLCDSAETISVSLLRCIEPNVCSNGYDLSAARAKIKVSIR